MDTITIFIERKTLLHGILRIKVEIAAEGFYLDKNSVIHAIEQYKNVLDQEKKDWHQLNQSCHKS